MLSLEYRNREKEFDIGRYYIYFLYERVKFISLHHKKIANLSRTLFI